MKRIAYGPLGLRPAQFWELTLKELEEMIDAHKFKEDIEWRKLAQLACWITAPHVKRPFTPDKLLKKQEEKKKTSQEETKEVLSELEAEFES